MRKIIPFLLLTVLAACSGSKNDADAYGNFESDEVILSAENNGKILTVSANEGDQVQKGFVLAVTDTNNLRLQVAQLLAQKESVLAQKSNVEAQIAVSDQQIANVNKDLTRIKRMIQDGAATQKQLDDVNGQIDLVNKQKKAYGTQLLLVQKQAEAVQSQINVLQDKLNSSIIKAPINGTILERYVEQGELAVPGKALYKLADLTNIYLRAYISETQLSQVKVGTQVKVTVDSGESQKEYTGVVSWVASQAEFTPKIIQTKEERVKLVYAIKVRVKNDGSLKIGMPGEVKF
jgi:HlyD family secretion protein